MGRGLLSWVAVAALVAAAVVTAGWGSGRTPAVGARSSASGTPASTAPPLGATGVRRAYDLVSDLDLLVDDLPAGYHAYPARGWEEWDTRETLCGVPLLQDRDHRLAVHRQDYFGAGRRRVRTEVLSYEPGHADRALDRIRGAAPRCTRPVPPGPTELPSTLALDVASRGATRQPHTELVVQRRGDVVVLLVVDGLEPGPLTRPAPLTVDLARVLAARLLHRLPDSSG